MVFALWVAAVGLRCTTMPPPEGGRQAYWAEVSGHTVDGTRLAGTFKAWVYTTAEGEFCYWELRRFFDILLADRVKNTRCDLALRRHKDVVVALFGVCGLAEQRDLKQSRRQVGYYMARGELSADFEDAFVRDEISISTAGVVAMAIAWGMTRKSMQDKGRGRAFLQMFLGIILTRAQVGGLDWNGMALGGDKCKLTTLDGTCLHWSDWASAGSEGGFVVQLVDRLFSLARHLAECPSARSAMRQVLGWVADQALETMPGRFSQQAMKMQHARGPKRLRRVDEDFKFDVMSRLPSAGRARSGAAAISVDDTRPCRRPCRWPSMGRESGIRPRRR